MNVARIASLFITVGLAASTYAVPALYQRHIGTPGIELGCAINTTRDGGSIFAGVRRNAAGGGANIVVVKLDYKGATMWEREVMLPNTEEIPLSITQTFDGGYALVADVSPAPAGMGLGILRLDPLGSYVWGQLWPGNPLGTGVHGAKILELPNRNLIIASRSSFVTGAAGQCPSIIQLTPGGGPLWAFRYVDVRYTAGQNGSFLDIRPFRDASGAPGFLACGWTQGFGAAVREPLVMFVNAAGAPMLSNLYAPPTVDLYFNGMEILPTSEVALTANDASPDSVYFQLTPFLGVGPIFDLPRFKAANESIFVVPPAGVIIGGNDVIAAGNGALARVDVGTGTFTHMSYGGVNTDVLAQIAPTTNGVFAIGTSRSFTHGLEDFWTFRSNVALRTGCIESPVPLAPIPVPAPVIPAQFQPMGLQFVTWAAPIVNVTDINTIICLICPADFNGDGVVDFFDYLDYVDAFSLGLPSADFNEDGVVDFFDYLDFVDAFSLGC